MLVPIYLTRTRALSGGSELTLLIPKRLSVKEIGCFLKILKKMCGFQRRPDLTFMIAKLTHLRTIFSIIM